MEILGEGAGGGRGGAGGRGGFFFSSSDKWLYQSCLAEGGVVSCDVLRCPWCITCFVNFVSITILLR